MDIHQITKSSNINVVLDPSISKSVLELDFFVRKEMLKWTVHLYNLANARFDQFEQTWNPPSKFARFLSKVGIATLEFSPDEINRRAVRSFNPIDPLSEDTCQQIQKGIFAAAMLADFGKYKKHSPQFHDFLNNNFRNSLLLELQISKFCFTAESIIVPDNSGRLSFMGSSHGRYAILRNPADFDGLSVKEIEEKVRAEMDQFAWTKIARNGDHIAVFDLFKLVDSYHYDNTQQLIVTHDVIRSLSRIKNLMKKDEQSENV